MNKTNEINVNGVIVRSVRIGRDDYISLTDIASLKNSTAPKDVVKNWMRSKMTVLFLGLWETINNPEFKGVEFDSFKSRAGENSFTLSPEQWIMATNAKGIVSRRGRYGGLKAAEQAQLGWPVKRELAKINYRIHTDAIQQMRLLSDDGDSRRLLK